MIKQIKMYGGDLIAEYDETLELKDEVFNKVIEWLQIHNATTGEAMQNDDFSIDAPVLIADILDDIIKFKTSWTTDDSFDLPI